MARPRLKLLPYQPGDMYRFKPRGDFEAERAAVGWGWAEGPPPGTTWTLHEFRLGGSRVLGVGGVFDAGNGGLHAWAVMSELTPRQWVVAGPLAEQALTGISEFRRSRRISATARISIEGAQTVLGKLGFEPRGEVVDPRLPDVVYKFMVRAA